MQININFGDKAFFVNNIDLKIHVVQAFKVFISESLLEIFISNSSNSYSKIIKKNKLIEIVFYFTIINK